jgi:hypothetical protein
VFYEFAKTWGDKYVTSNVKIYNNKTKTYEYPGVQSRYWTTHKGKCHPQVPSTSASRTDPFCQQA